ncbi:MAG: class I SAM-dependent methyltransferase [Alphaproteobacteria bacterium]|nr:class I SAM-dependent methyltransferase [Alphaproteobacteria bacterium]
MKENFCSPSVAMYALKSSRGESGILHKLREETDKLPEAGMMISPLQAHFLSFLIKWGRVKTVLEIGTFTGYSSLAMTLALPEEGMCVTLDKDEKWAEIAKKFWEVAGVSHKINLRLGLAHKTLEVLKGPFDMVFVDADKQRYGVYYEFALELVRPGGLLVFDNTLRNGTVVDENNQEETPGVLHERNKGDNFLEMRISELYFF